ncbi:MAG TPA: hypothetical protein DEF06_08410 [Clostridiales bacterium]|nr:hypothetical protein [Clostridiales bacterium]
MRINLPGISRFGQMPMKKEVTFESAAHMSFLSKNNRRLYSFIYYAYKEIAIFFHRHAAASLCSFFAAAPYAIAFSLYLVLRNSRSDFRNRHLFRGKHTYNRPVPFLPFKP